MYVKRKHVTVVMLNWMSTFYNKSLKWAFECFKVCLKCEICRAHLNGRKLANYFCSSLDNIFQQPFEHRIVKTKTNNTGLLNKLKMFRIAENIFKR